jgi:2,3-bisphosphoglycerate-independent phosphoglycerate mutase
MRLREQSIRPLGRERFQDMKAIEGPLVLCILDGWGCRSQSYGNAIALAELPNWRRFVATYPHSELSASGTDVGLPKGVMGNSEVGHINIGSGRVVPQGLVVIDEAVSDGSFAQNPALLETFEHVRRSGGRLHLMGLVSDGKVHSSFEHLLALIDTATAGNVPFAIHAFGDGRDVPPSSLHEYIDALTAHLAAAGRPDAIATVSGRYYAMDRDKRWDRVEQAYEAIASGRTAHHAATAAEAIDAAYERGETDEFIVPTAIGEARPVSDGDAILFFNFRPDRARELTAAFSDPAFSAFPVHVYRDLPVVTMTKYEEYFTNPVLFGPRPQALPFGEIVASAGMKQLRLAETEKYAHVTYFFNGGREDVFAGEDRELIASDRSVATYDLAPAMRAEEITVKAVEAIASGTYDLIVMNYANADMVGHTGVLDATIAACEILDRAFAALETAVLAADGVLAITADHGNAEEKLDEDGHALTAHTTNPVPLVLVSKRPLGPLADGKLGDIAPTLLPLLGLSASGPMDGKDLRAPVPALND